LQVALIVRTVICTNDGINNEISISYSRRYYVYEAYLLAIIKMVYSLKSFFKKPDIGGFYTG